MQRDQNQESRITPFIPSQDATQLSADIRTISFGTEKIVHIPDNAQKRPSSGNLGGLSHSLSTTTSVDESQTSQTMTQLSKYPVQGQEKHSEYSQQQNSSSARASATSLDPVQQIPSHESQMFTKYFTQGKGVQEFSGFSYGISQSQTESITVDNAEALKTMYDNSLNIEPSSLPDILDVGPTSIEGTVVDSNGNIKVVSELTEPVFHNKQNELYHQAASNLIPMSSFAAPFTQGNTQAAVYAEDKNKNVHNLEIKPCENKNVNQNVAKCDTNIKLIPDTTSTCDNEGMSDTVNLKQRVCDYVTDPNILRVESNANQTSPFLSDFHWNNSSQTGLNIVQSVNSETYVEQKEISLASPSWTLYAPSPLHWQTCSRLEQVADSNRLDPPIMTPLAARDIARKHTSSNNYSVCRQTVTHDQHNSVIKRKNRYIETETELNFSKVVPSFQSQPVPSTEEPVPNHRDSPDSNIVDCFGAVDLSKSVKKTKQEKPEHTTSRSPRDSRVAREVHMPTSACFRSAFHPVPRSGLSPNVGSLSLRGNIEGSGSYRQDNNINHTVIQAANDRFQEAMLDDEVSRYFRLGLLDARSPVQRCYNPIAKTLIEGDEMVSIYVENKQS